MGIAAVIWDVGGVFASSAFEAFSRYEASNGLPEGFLRRVNATNPDANAWALFERNGIDTAGFDRLFLEESSALGHPVPGREVLPLLTGEVRPRMIAALKVCKTRFKVGCITNNMATEHGAGLDGLQQLAGAMAEI